MRVWTELRRVPPVGCSGPPGLREPPGGVQDCTQCGFPSHALGVTINASSQFPCGSPDRGRSPAHALGGRLGAILRMTRSRRPCRPVHARVRVGGGRVQALAAKRRPVDRRGLERSDSRQSLDSLGRRPEGQGRDQRERIRRSAHDLESRRLCLLSGASGCGGACLGVGRGLGGQVRRAPASGEGEGEGEVETEA